MKKGVIPNYPWTIVKGLCQANEMCAHSIRHSMICPPSVPIKPHPPSLSPSLSLFHQIDFLAVLSAYEACSHPRAFALAFSSN